MRGIWNELPLPVRRKIDEALKRRMTIPAVFALRDESGLDPQMSLHDALDIALERSAWLNSQGLVEPEPVVDLPRLIAQTEDLPAAPVAIEAVWDGDTTGWFVELAAIIRRPGQHHPSFDEVCLAFIRRGGDIRLFNGAVPPWPEAAEATELGTALAAHLGVPFHFTDPDTPGDRQPRWWDSAPSGTA